MNFGVIFLDMIALLLSRTDVTLRRSLLPIEKLKGLLHLSVSDVYLIEDVFNNQCTVPYPGVDKVKVKVNVKVKLNVRRRLGGGDAKYRPRQEKGSPR